MRAKIVNTLVEAVREIEQLVRYFDTANAIYSRSGEVVQGHIYNNCANKLWGLLRKCKPSDPAAIRGPGAAVHG